MCKKKKNLTKMNEFLKATFLRQSGLKIPANFETKLRKYCFTPTNGQQNCLANFAVCHQESDLCTNLPPDFTTPWGVPLFLSLCVCVCAIRSGHRSVSAAGVWRCTLLITDCRWDALQVSWWGKINSSVQISVESDPLPYHCAYTLNPVLVDGAGSDRADRTHSWPLDGKSIASYFIYCIKSF